MSRESIRNEASGASQSETVPAEPVAVLKGEDRGAVGSVLGRYVVLGELGRGAMGRVVRAYDPKLQREVALKVVRATRFSGDPSDGHAQVVAEARAMAKLAHPNVVAVYDVEELGEDRSVVIVMELVEGETLRRWLEGARPWREILETFVLAGRGLAAAHHAGLLHRDFKPTNVFVGGRSLVKVGDFGLAQFEAKPESSPEAGLVMSDADATDRDTIAGTPRYMAPEQHRGEPLGSASDQYAFCVSVWEALNGFPPFSGPGVLDQKLAGPPAWSAKGVPRRIADAIERGLRIDPTARWPHLDDLLSALALEPRSRWTWPLLTAGALGIAGFAVATANGPAEPEDERCTGAQSRLDGVWGRPQRAALHEAFSSFGLPYANSTAQRISNSLDEEASRWAETYTEACAATTIRGEQSPRVMDSRMACLERVRDDISAAVEMLISPDRDVLLHADRIVRGIRPLEACSDVAFLESEHPPPTAQEAGRVDELQNTLAEIRTLRLASHFDEAETAIDGTEARLLTLEYPRIHIAFALEKAAVLERVGKYEEMESTLRQALRAAIRHGYDGAIRESATMLIRVVGGRTGQPAEALRYRDLAEALAKDPLSQSVVADVVGIALLAKGDLPGAQAEFERAIDLVKQDARADDVDMEFARSHLALVLTQSGRLDEALREYDAIIEAKEQRMGADHPAVAVSRGNRAGVLRQQGRYDEAEREIRQVVAMNDRSLRPGHPSIGDSLNELAGVLWNQEKVDEAIEVLERAIEITAAEYGQDHPRVASYRSNLATLLSDQGQHEQAATVHRESLAALQTLGEDAPHLALTRADLASVLLRLERADEAVGYAERAWTRYERGDLTPDDSSRGAFVLARALWDASERRDRQRALILARTALRIAIEGGEPTARRSKLVRAWLDERDI